MDKQELFKKIADAIVQLNENEVRTLIETSLDQGLDREAASGKQMEILMQSVPLGL